MAAREEKNGDENRLPKSLPREKRPMKRKRPIDFEKTRELHLLSLIRKIKLEEGRVFHLVGQLHEDSSRES